MLFACVAAMYPAALNKRNEGATACMLTVNGGLDTPPLVTTTGTGPTVLSSGVRMLSWSWGQIEAVAALQKNSTKAGLLLTVTLTPPSCVGINPEAKEGALLQMVPLAGVLAGTRFVPLITMKSSWAMTAPA